MNIAAAMTAIRLDLDGADKLALLVLAARAGRDVWTVTRSVPALAADMGVSERTARRAVAALRRKGYLQVSHTVGITSTYRMVTPDNMTGVTPDNLTGVPRSICHATPDNMTAVRRKTGERLEAPPGTPTPTAPGDVVENGAAATWQPARRAHPGGCECGGTGWLDDPDTREVTRCEH